MGRREPRPACKKIAMTSSGERFFDADHSRKVPPGTNCMATKSWGGSLPSTRPTSWTATTLEWVSLAMAWASWISARESPASSLRSSLRATRRSRSGS
nr:hypothetical protein [Plesiocystis pacifica]